MKKISIEQVDNGYVVKITNQGKSMLKESYETPTLVFNSLEVLMDFIRKFESTVGDE